MSIMLPAETPLLGGVLGISAIGVWLSGRREFVLRWLSFFAATPVLVLAASLGRPGAVGLAISIAVVCSWEYARMAGLDRYTTGALLIGVGTAIGFSVAHRNVPIQLLLLLSLLVPVIGARSQDGLRLAAIVAFGTLWLGCSVTALVDLGAQLLPIAVAVSLADVAAYFGGGFANRRAKRWPILALRLNRLSPNKTWSGAVAGTIAALVTLAVLNDFTAAAAIAVTGGAVFGDLIESMVKRGSGVKDAGKWLPGFGGLLDRVDSLLGALLVLAVLS
jgi:phosphatidate cytidylyltransferase